VAVIPLSRSKGQRSRSQGAGHIVAASRLQLFICLCICIWKIRSSAVGSTATLIHTEIYFEERLEYSFELLCAATVSNPAVRNVAFLMQSTQVSTYSDVYGQHPSSLAIDGSRQTNANVTVNGCAVSRRATNPWWAVDLGGPTVVCLVKLTNRGDANGKFLTDLQVTVNAEVSPRRQLKCLGKRNVIILTAESTHSLCTQREM